MTLLSSALVLLGLVNIYVTPKLVARPLNGDQSPTPEAVTADTLAQEVVPDEGYVVQLNWGETGKKLVAAGGIDMVKYKELYGDSVDKDLFTYLTESKDTEIVLTKENAYFWVNTLWALGLTQKSDVLDKGVMGTTYRDRLDGFASTGGWTLGSKEATELYSSADIVPLTQYQQDLVAKVSSGIYRPCCGNPASFPDCNHGMAILGLLELMASQGATEDEMYSAALAFNSYWFTQTYVDLAYYFRTQAGMAWADVDPRVILSAEYSSAQGYSNVKKQIGDIPGSQTSGASCST